MGRFVGWFENNAQGGAFSYESLLTGMGDLPISRVNEGGAPLATVEFALVIGKTGLRG